MNKIVRRSIFLLVCIVAGTAAFASWRLLGHRRDVDPPPPVPFKAGVSLAPSWGAGGVAAIPPSVPLVRVNDSSRWKGVGIVAETPNGPKLDAGLGYEFARVKIKGEPKVPLTGWRLGSIELPELTSDLVLTPNRAGIGGGLAITDHLDLEAGVSKPWGSSAQETYVGLGWHFAF